LTWSWAQELVIQWEAWLDLAARDPTESEWNRWSGNTWYM